MYAYAINPYQEGYNAGINDRQDFFEGYTSNPYNAEEDPENFAVWSSGYSDGFAYLYLNCD